MAQASVPEARRQVHEEAAAVWQVSGPARPDAHTLVQRGGLLDEHHILPGGGPRGEVRQLDQNGNCRKVAAVTAELVKQVFHWPTF